MKNKKTALLLVLGAILLVAATMFGTVAYLTSTDTVENTFTVGKVAITLDESPVDAAGKAVAGDRVKANGYKLVPGREYDKDPTIHVDASSEAAYLFVAITDEIAAIQDSKTVAEQLEENGWKALDATPGVYYYDVSTDVAGEDIPVFRTFKVKATATNEQLAPLNGKKIIVKAYAVQAEGFTDAKDAWTKAGFTA